MFKDQVNILEFIHFALKENKECEVSKFDFSETHWTYNLVEYLIPVHCLPKIVVLIFNYVKMQLYMLYMSLTIIYHKTEYDVIITDSASIAFPLLRLQTKNL